MKNSVNVGDVFQSNNYGKFRVIEVKNYDNVFIKFEATGFECKATKAQINRGSVKDRLVPSVEGVGFIGDGPHPTSIGGATKEYTTWQDMLARCYDKKVHAKQPTYIGCKVDPQWHNFQEFAEWCQWQKGFEKEWRLDKDLLYPTNKIYSPETCVFLPNEINASLNFKRTGNYCGVSYHKLTNKFVSQVRCGDENKHLGLFEDEFSAYVVYKSAKEEYIKVLADKYKIDLDSRAYEALMVWEVVQRV